MVIVLRNTQGFSFFGKYKTNLLCKIFKRQITPMLSLYQFFFKIGCHFYVCVCKNECHASPGVYGGQRRLLSPLEIQVVASCLTCELGSHQVLCRKQYFTAEPFHLCCTHCAKFKEAPESRKSQDFGISIRSHCRYIMSL